MAKNNSGKTWYKKWWVWLIILFVIGSLNNLGKNESEVTPEKAETKTEQTENKVVAEKTKVSETIILDSGSELRRILTLNKGTDLPNDEILYKVPAGKYKVTTDFEKVASFAVVKDQVNLIEGDYPEELNYVSEMYNITANPENFNEKLAKSDAVIEVAEDESISVPTDDRLFLEKQ